MFSRAAFTVCAALHVATFIVRLSALWFLPLFVLVNAAGLCQRLVCGYKIHLSDAPRWRILLYCAVGLYLYGNVVAAPYDHAAGANGWLRIISVFLGLFAAFIEGELSLADPDREPDPPSTQW